MGLRKYFPAGGIFRRKGLVHAVDDISFSIMEREAMGLVGESGCGKTTAGKCILRLIEPAAGEIRYLGNDLISLKKSELQKIRREMQMIFQDPFSSLNPIMNIESIVGDGLTIHGIAEGKERSERVSELLGMIGLEDYHKYRYPHEFSGGQKQRIAIARALATNPKFIVADEPVAALDVSIQAQILNLLHDLQEEFGLTVLLISHNLNVVKHFCDKVAVMYVGKIVEVAERDELFSNLKHPYTEALISSILTVDPRIKTRRIILTGEVPTAINPPPGCRFSTRCRYSKPICSKEEPPLVDIGGGHLVACHFWDSLSLQSFKYS